MKSKYLCLVAVLFLLISCNSNDRPVAQSVKIDDERLTDTIADSVELQKSLNEVSDKENVESTFAPPITVLQEDFKAGSKLAYYLPVTIKNISGRRIKGIVLERTGKGLDKPIPVRKFQVSIMPGKSIKIRLTVRDLDVTEESIYQSDGINSRRFMHIIASQVIFSDGEIKNVFNFPEED